MSKKQLQYLKKIMALKFVVLELSLYLNTHPCDEVALEDHQKYACKLKDLMRNYQQEYGPVTPDFCYKQSPWQAECKDDYYWKYIRTEWPWQINY